MDTSTETHPHCASNEPHLPVVVSTLQDASDAPSLSSSHVFMTDDTPLPNLKQLDSNSCVIIIQNNRIAEGGTININSSYCNGSTVTKLEHVTPSAGSKPEEPASMMQPDPMEQGRDAVSLNGNTFGDYAMINVNSQNCTGGVKQTALPSRFDGNI
ncbi:hypothetical protein DEU56DRAFT_914630 [Suillus clintonianus]|uniref:uncharacterized protein n=1 Tax=Suillus clintonianus TaxID=1904413 RepID=UPI001B863780|nr:uncharacterized protein DEU56DRAFT_914630 [Suillus clintonianus]KAG2130864.1 hypothetical protein DEU56DRAFT_914630 [Suillus clintonianus]